MDIAPILGVPAVSQVKPDRLAPDLSRVFEAEYLGADDAEEPDSLGEDAGGDADEGGGAESYDAEGEQADAHDPAHANVDCFA